MFAARPAIIGNGVQSLDTDAAAIVNAMQVRPTLPAIQAIQSLVSGAKLAGVWPLWSNLWVPKALTVQAAAMDFKSPTGTPAIFQNGLTLIPGAGVQGDGVSAYYGTQVAFNAVAGTSVSDVHIGAVGASTANNNNMISLFGLNGGSSTALDRSAINAIRGRLSATAAVSLGSPPSVGSVPNHLMWVRNNALTIEGFVDGVSLGTGAITTTIVNPSELTGLRINALFGGSNIRPSVFHVGPAVTATQAADMARLLLTFVRAWGSLV